jgi:hypothetical protein
MTTRIKYPRLLDPVTQLYEISPNHWGFKCNDPHAGWMQCLRPRRKQQADSEQQATSEKEGV